MAELLDEGFERMGVRRAFAMANAAPRIASAREVAFNRPAPQVTAREGGVRMPPLRLGGVGRPAGPQLVRAASRPVVMGAVARRNVAQLAQGSAQGSAQGGSRGMLRAEPPARLAPTTAQRAGTRIAEAPRRAGGVQVARGGGG
jgi:hypothetical protein